MRKPAAERYVLRKKRKAEREKAEAELAAARAAVLGPALERHRALVLVVARRHDCLSWELVQKHAPVLHWAGPAVQCTSLDHHGVGTWPCDIVRALEFHGACEEDRCAHSE